MKIGRFGIRVGDLVRIIECPVNANPWIKEMYLTKSVAVVANTHLINRRYIEIHWNGQMRMPSTDLLEVVSRV
jgi:hypothetical protein|tara:strand:+ start:416 stop:634 length:219 start_codon:yes stop_codon:yes gene_type:complete